MIKRDRGIRYIFKAAGMLLAGGFMGYVGLETRHTSTKAEKTFLGSTSAAGLLGAAGYLIERKNAVPRLKSEAPKVGS